MRKAEIISSSSFPAHQNMLLVRCAGGENYYSAFIDVNDDLYVGKNTNGTWQWTNGGGSGADHSSYNLYVAVWDDASTTCIDVYVNGATEKAMGYSDSTSPHTSVGIGVEARSNNAAFLRRQLRKKVNRELVRSPVTLLEACLHWVLDKMKKLYKRKNKQKNKIPEFFHDFYQHLDEVEFNNFQFYGE